jgi:hypothetical protein
MAELYWFAKLYTLSKEHIKSTRLGGLSLGVEIAVFRVFIELCAFI